MKKGNDNKARLGVGCRQFSFPSFSPRCPPSRTDEALQTRLLSMQHIKGAPQIRLEGDSPVAIIGRGFETATGTGTTESPQRCVSQQWILSRADINPSELGRVRGGGLQRKEWTTPTEHLTTLLYTSRDLRWVPHQWSRWRPLVRFHLVASRKKEERIKITVSAGVSAFVASIQHWRGFSPPFFMVLTKRQRFISQLSELRLLPFCPVGYQRLDPEGCCKLISFFVIPDHLLILFCFFVRHVAVIV